MLLEVAPSIRERFESVAPVTVLISGPRAVTLSGFEEVQPTLLQNGMSS
jgi:hypothetical protein